MLYPLDEAMSRSESADSVLIAKVEVSISNTGSMIAASLVLGQAIMYCHVPVLLSWTVWMIGCMMIMTGKQALCLNLHVS